MRMSDWPRAAASIPDRGRGRRMGEDAPLALRAAGLGRSRVIRKGAEPFAAERAAVRLLRNPVAAGLAVQHPVFPLF